MGAAAKELHFCRALLHVLTAQVRSEGWGQPCQCRFLHHLGLRVLLCSMGGILVKEMLRLACLETAPPHQRQLAAATVGLVFYACPHRGSWLANLGWNLRWLGASPASSVPYLVPGPHLEASCCACCTVCHRIALHNAWYQGCSWRLVAGAAEHAPSRMVLQPHLAPGLHLEVCL